MSDIYIHGKRHRFIPHSGRAAEPVELPSRSETVRIMAVVAMSYGVPQKCMVAKSRSRDHSWPRQVAMFLTRELTHRSLPAIGKAFGGRDHTTVIHAIHQVEARMKADPIYLADIEVLRDALKERLVA